MRKYNDETRAAIVAAYASDEKTKSIKERFGVPHSTILRYVRAAGHTMRIERNKRQQVIKLSLSNPDLGPSEIARIVGAHKQHVIRTRTECGFKTVRHSAKPAPRRVAIAILHAQNPDLGADSVAKIVGCTIDYAMRTLKRIKTQHVAPAGAPAPDQGGLQSLSQ